MIPTTCSVWPHAHGDRNAPGIGSGRKHRKFGSCRRWHQGPAAGGTTYQAATWPHARRIVMKAEVLAKSTNTRFVATTRREDPATVYAAYVRRGASENWIKDLKLGCTADRLSCHRFWANQFRLLLHAAAYWLLDTVRGWLVRAQIARMTLMTVRLRLLKLGGWVREHQHRVHLRLTSSHPGEA